MPQPLLPHQPDTSVAGATSDAGTGTGSPTATAGASGVLVLPGPRRVWPLRVCLALNVLGAGAPGAVLLVAPQLAPDVAGAAAEPQVARLVGAIWLSIGVVSVLYLRTPQHARGLLATQVLYKSVYIAGVGVPAVVAGTASSTTTGLTAGFGAMVAAWSSALLATRRNR